MSSASGFVTALLAAACVSCATVQVTYDPLESFAHYRSWDWLPVAADNTDRIVLDVGNVDVARHVRHQAIAQWFVAEAFDLLYKLAFRQRRVGYVSHANSIQTTVVGRRVIQPLTLCVDCDTGNATLERIQAAEERKVLD